MRQTLLKRGLPRKLYFDNGPAFRAHHLEEITAFLGIALVHSPPYVPQGKGKIEKLFRTVRSQFLPGFKGDSLWDINEALGCWIRDVYYQRKHLGIGQLPVTLLQQDGMRRAGPRRPGRLLQKKGHAPRDPGSHRLPGRQTIRGPRASDRQANHPPLARP
ncbi:transposase [Desulfarculales bacterium]